MRRVEDKLPAKGRILLTGLWLLQLVCRGPFVRECYRRLVIGLIRRHQLFDKAHYLSANEDVAESGAFPLRHYVEHGDHEGRSPLPLFEPDYYRGQVGSVLTQVNALLHYLWVGRYQRISPSPWFDIEYYLAHNRDVSESGKDPLLHYLRCGGLEGRAPSPEFDSSYYLRRNPQLAADGVNPLVHYVAAGRSAGLAARAEQDIDGGTALIEQSLPSAQAWRDLVPRGARGDAFIDVIVPVYTGRVETLCCLYSVLAAACDTPFELVVVNDASPDAELAADLGALAEQGLLTLLTNPENRGFVGTVNRAMGLHQSRDVVLLNADTEVYDGWLDRLYDAATRHDSTATVTPLSNNATICSYPHFLQDNPFPLELDYSELDKLTAATNARVTVKAPTAVGFCMYISRRCLAEIGLFDEQAFGRGYGEENDFCQRAIGQGWRNLVAADVFVRHLGAASFQGEKATRVDNAMAVLGQRFPQYEQDVAAFVRRDPLLGARRRLDWARLERTATADSVLIVCHDRGGGAERRVREDAQQYLDAGRGVFFLRPVGGNSSRVVVRHPADEALPNLGTFALTDGEGLTNLLQSLGITEIHAHSLVDFAEKAPEYVVQLAQALDARLEINLHDYEFICPRINLVDSSDRYCGEPAPRQCRKCLKRNGSDFGVSDIELWRRQHGQALKAADAVWVPDEDVSSRLARYFPAVDFQVEPHEDPATLVANNVQWHQPQRHNRRIVVIGAISEIKGYDVLLACARDAQARALPLEFVVLGHSRNDKALEQAGVVVTGRYLEGQAQQNLIDLAPDMVWLPSVWPETYSYTLSIALAVGAPVAAFDIGAIARRLRARGAAQNLMPLDWVDDCRRVNDALLRPDEQADAYGSDQVA